MKKSISFLLSFLFLFFFTGLSLSSLAQQPVEKIPSAKEEEEWNSAADDEDILTKIPAAEKAKATEHAQAILAYTLKAVLNRSDPAKYPLNNAEKSPQTTILASLQRLPPYTFNKMKEKANLLLSDATKRAAVLGKFKDLDFKKKSIDSDIQKIRPVKFNPTLIKGKDASSLNYTGNNYAGMPGTSQSVVNDKNSFSKMDFVLRAIRCLDETNPESGDDDIVIGGLKIGCSGNSSHGYSAVSCHFDDGDYCDHGHIPLGGYNLSSCSGYPKTFYFIIQLLEVDSDEREAAQALEDIMAIAAEALQGTGYGEAIAYVAQAVEVLSGWLFDDDAFHPYGATTTLYSQNSFGSDGRSSYRRAVISDHGGSYRVGYQWQLRN
ncbi:MAG: hypothetical protein ABI688_01270 [Bacteroidota bacterium]